MEDVVRMYHSLGLTQSHVLIALATHGIIVSKRHLRRILRKLNLSRRKNYSDIGEVAVFISNCVTSGQQHGYRWLFHKCESHGFKVRKEDVRLILAALDPAGSVARRARRLRRRTYKAKGPNFLWHIDGYDKIKPFGLAIHGCIDGFSRKIIWLNAYSTNNDPRIVAGYFFNAIKEMGGCPFKMRGDRGTENVTVKQMQTQLVHEHNGRYLEGTSTANQRIECFWGHLRKQCIQLWIDILHMIQDNGDFTGDHLDKNLVLFCFLPQLQVCFSLIAIHIKLKASIVMSVILCLKWLIK